MSGPSFPAWLAKIRGVTLPLAGATGLTAESHHRIVYSVVLTSASYSVYVCPDAANGRMRRHFSVQDGIALLSRQKCALFEVYQRLEQSKHQEDEI